ncbi:MAG TPA: ImmA/IrrE family metallo-endopeptidase [Rhizomicrobium sp.]|nr:ImmA/IrrE family metallo-endopeptidase [Rhizomicrobium sp.]
MTGKAWLAGSLLLAMTVPGQLSAGQNSRFSDLRALPEFKYVRAYFPDREVDYGAGAQMTKDEIAVSTKALQRVLDTAIATAAAKSAGLQILLSKAAVAAPAPQEAPVKVQVIDDGTRWANASAEGGIKLSPEVLRGLMLGSLRASAAGGGDLRSMMMASLFADSGDKLPTDKAVQEKRFQLVLDVISHARTGSVTGTLFGMLWSAAATGEPDSGKPPASELEPKLRDWAARRESIPLFSELELVAGFGAFQTHYVFAERFLLAHELGHILLGHAPHFALEPDETDEAFCMRMKPMEDQADAFAIALLVMDDDFAVDASLHLPLGGLLVALASSDDDQTEDAGDLDAGDFDFLGQTTGYSDLFDYVLEEAHLSGRITSSGSCRYRDAKDRSAFVAGLRKAFYGARRAAVKELDDYRRARPPSMAVNYQSNAEVSSDEVFALFPPKCDGVKTTRTVKRDPRGGNDYIQRCYWPVPEETAFSAETRALAGQAAMERFLADYRAP